MATAMLFRRQGFHVVGIGATWIAADLMMQLPIRGYHSLRCLVKESMGKFALCPDRHPCVPLIVGVTQPNPASSSRVDSVEIGRVCHPRATAPVGAIASVAGRLWCYPFLLAARFANDRDAANPVGIARADIGFSLSLCGARPAAESTGGFARAKVIRLCDSASLAGNGRVVSRLSVDGHNKTPLGRASREGGTDPEKAVRRRVMTPPKSRLHLRTFYHGQES